MSWEHIWEVPSDVVKRAASRDAEAQALIWLALERDALALLRSHGEEGVAAKARQLELYRLDKEFPQEVLGAFVDWLSKHGWPREQSELTKAAYDAVATAANQLLEREDWVTLSHRGENEDGGAELGSSEDEFIGADNDEPSLAARERGGKLTQCRKYPCRNCGGTGWLELDGEAVRCPHCDGTGIPAPHDLKCHIPKKWKDKLGFRLHPLGPPDPGPSPFNGVRKAFEREAQVEAAKWQEMIVKVINVFVASREPWSPQRVSIPWDDDQPRKICKNLKLDIGKWLLLDSDEEIILDLNEYIKSPKPPSPLLSDEYRRRIRQLTHMALAQLFVPDPPPQIVRFVIGPRDPQKHTFGYPPHIRLKCVSNRNLVPNAALQELAHGDAIMVLEGTYWTPRSYSEKLYRFSQLINRKGEKYEECPRCDIRKCPHPWWRCERRVIKDMRDRKTKKRSLYWRGLDDFTRGWVPPEPPVSPVSVPLEVEAARIATRAALEKAWKARGRKGMDPRSQPIVEWVLGLPALSPQITNLKGKRIGHLVSSEVCHPYAKPIVAPRTKESAADAERAGLALRIIDGSRLGFLRRFVETQLDTCTQRELAALGPAQREVVLAYSLAGWPVKRIVQETGKSEPAVRMALSRANRKLSPRARAKLGLDGYNRANGKKSQSN